jgi:hypothetical protein
MPPTPVPTPEPDRGPDDPIMTLRGAGVDADARRVGLTLSALSAVALAVLAVIFAVAGAQRNHQIDQLRQHGVDVQVTVTTCQGLLGGSGSNSAGEACHGTFTLDGRRYTDAIPGDKLVLGASVRGVTLRSDPGLLSTVTIVNSEHSSGNVFILPAVLLVLAILVGALVNQRWRRRAAAATTPS